MIRALRPTDAFAYLTFAREAPPSAAIGQLGVERTESLVRGFLGRSFALEPSHENWVQIEHRQIRGLISACRRFGADIWDIDQLVLLPAPDAQRTCRRLVDHLVNAAIDDGVQKVFVRLRSDDDSVDALMQSGFFKYCDEVVFYRPEIARPARSADVPGLRPRRAKDHLSLFQLYCSAVPAQVRQAEAMTLQEWRWSDGWEIQTGGWRQRLARNRLDYVVHADSGIVAWLRIDLSARLIVPLIAPGAAVDLSEILQFAVERLRPGLHAHCVIRTYQGGLESSLDEQGFQIRDQYTLLVRGLAIRVPDVKLVPVRAL